MMIALKDPAMLFFRQRTEAQICSSHGASSMSALLRSSKVDVATQAAEAAASLAACSPTLVPAPCFPPLVALLQVRRPFYPATPPW